MAPSNSCFSSVFLVLLALHFSRIHQVMSLIITPPNCKPIEATDVDRVQFALNLEFCQAEYFLYGTFGKGLDSISPNLTAGGPPPIGVQKALLLNPEVARISEEIAYQQVGNIRSIFETVGGFPRPLLNLSVTLWALLFDLALKKPLIPPFNPYRNSLSFLLAAYAMPDLAQTSYVSSISSFTTNSSSSLASKLLAIKAGQSAVIRTLLYQNATQFVPPYQITVAEFTKAISELTNILEPEILRIVYGTGNEHLPSGFFPKGANGKIARSYILS
ncbi:hypothetical protein M0R45_011143 [Rubus argutus]|uniref:Desiccation-related protein PCC13-62 n=1 Tax=Rubus argutus TaxID=59490 RepID=A0AAW1Y997_RUBAR